MASSVALVSDRSPNFTASSPQLHPSVSGDQDPAVAFWGGRQGPAQVRHAPAGLHWHCHWLPGMNTKLCSSSGNAEDAVASQGGLCPGVPQHPSRPPAAHLLPPAGSPGPLVSVLLSGATGQRGVLNLQHRVCNMCGVCSPVADYLYGSSSPPQTTTLPDCGSASQPPPALLPASLDWPLEEKELPDLFAAKVAGAPSTRGWPSP